MIKTFDVVIVGAGGAGLRAAVEIPKEYSCAVISKSFSSAFSYRNCTRQCLCCTKLYKALQTLN